MSIKSLLRTLCILLPSSFLVAQSNSLPIEIDSYLQPYIHSNNFSGTALVQRNGRTLFEKAYGFADREHSIRNTTTTRFHIASMSMQFTAAAVLRLVDSGAISLQDTVGAYLPGIAGADKITISDLLNERSGLPDINNLPDYDELLQHHQIPATLVGKIDGRPLLFEPGSKFLHEEHSAYNLLALIVEKKTGLPFAAAVQRLVFQPMGLKEIGVDDDTVPHSPLLAKGYQPEGSYGVKPATSIHWSAKTGNASVYASAKDEAQWVSTLFQGQLLTPSSRNAMLDPSIGVGYGWFKSQNKRFGGLAYSMNGRAPGFASFVMYLPREQLTVVVLSNIYSSATSTIGYDIAALVAGLPYPKFHLRHPAPTAEELKTCTGNFQFGADFFQPNAIVALTSNGPELSLHWPSGDTSSLIALEPDHFIDRSYWEDVKIERDLAGHPDKLLYDRFEGKATKP